MGSFEPAITQVHLYSDDDFINNKISKQNFSNIKLYGSNEIKAENKSKILDFSFGLEYFNEEIVQSIIGEKINNIPKEICEIYFVSSKEQFIKFQNFKGIIICLESSYIDKVRTCNTIVIREKEQVLSVIRSIYYSLNSYHIFPYDLDMIIGNEFNIFIDNIEIQQTGEFNIIVWNHKNSESHEKLKAIFISSKDSSICQFEGTSIYNYIIEKINKSYLDIEKSSAVLAINYTQELI